LAAVVSRGAARGLSDAGVVGLWARAWAGPRSAVVGFCVAVWRGGAVVTRPRAGHLRSAVVWATLKATRAELDRAWSQVVGWQRPSPRIEQCSGRLWCRWSAVVRRGGRRGGRPSALGPEWNGGCGLTLRAADAATPRANVGGFSFKNHAPTMALGQRRRAADAIVRR